MGNAKGVRRDFDALEQRRFAAAKLLAQGLNQSEISRLKVSNQAVSQWARLLHGQGEKGLRQAGRAGRLPRLGSAEKARLEKRLEQGPQRLGYETSLWTSERVAELIRDEFGVRYHPGHVWKILVSLGWSCQRPVGRALERDEEAIRVWKKTTWPDIKKKPANKGARSSFWTRAD